MRSSQRLTVYLLLGLSVTGCGGRTANPIMPMQYGDQQKSCESLQFELANTEGEMRRLLAKSDKTGQNVALGVAGAFLLVPWFFMDFKNAEKTEYEAYRQRYNNLASLAISKECEITPARFPSVDEIQQQQQERNPQQSPPMGPRT